MRAVSLGVVAIALVVLNAIEKEAVDAYPFVIFAWLLGSGLASRKVRFTSSFVVAALMLVVTDAVADADVAVPDGSGNATIYLTLPGLSEQKPYKLSLGLFDQQGHLVKWFDGIANVELKGGVAETPNLSQLALENPCHG